MMKGCVATVNVLEIAMDYIDQEQIEKAIELLDESIAGAAPDTAFGIAEIYRQLGFYEKAVPVLEELVTMFPEEIELLTALADIYIELGEDEKALELIGEPETDPEDPQYLEMMLQQADLYQSQGLFEVAEQKLLLAKQHYPNEMLLDFALAELLFSIGDYSRAAHFYENVLAKEQSVAGIVITDRLAECMALLGNQERALELYQQEELEDPEHLFRYGFTAYQSDRMDIAIQAWEKLINTDPEYLTVYSLLAKAYENDNMIKEAYETSKKGLEKDTFNKDLYFEAGAFAYQLGLFDEGETMLREAIALDPDYKDAILYLARVLQENEQFEDVIDLIESISELGAEDALYNWILAKAFAETEDYKQALKQYRQAYISLQDDRDFLKEFGYFLVEEGFAEEAVNVLQTYLLLEPLDAETASFVERLGDHQQS